MGTGYQANMAKGTRSKDQRADKCRHTVTMLSTLFDAIRDAALANNHSISEEMVARLSASFATVPASGQGKPTADRGERVAAGKAGTSECKALADEAIDALEPRADHGKGVS